MMGIGPVPSSKIALAKAGLSIDDMDLIEVNEAFAAQTCAVERELSLPRERLNVHGGAIALSVAVVKPDSRGTVTLRSRDPYEQPEIDCNFLAEKRDARRMLEGVKLARKIGRNPALARFIELEMIPGDAVTDDRLLDAVASNLASYGHPTATAPMGGPDDPRAVVDTHGAVKGLSGLRVVDASIMPVVPSVAINPTTIMVAERIAKTVYAG